MKHPLALLSLAVVLFSLAVARGTTVIAPDFEKLVRDAELIFQGQVTDVHSQWIGEGAEHRIVSFVTFKVEDVTKGKAGPDYTIRMLGGTVDGRTMEVTDAPKFKVGDRDMLFVENNGSQFVPLVGIMHGRFRVEKEAGTGREILLTNSGQPLTNPEQLGKDEHAASAGARAVSPAEFKAAVRSRLQVIQ